MSCWYIFQPKVASFVHFDSKKSIQKYQTEIEQNNNNNNNKKTFHLRIMQTIARSLTLSLSES